MQETDVLNNGNLNTASFTYDLAGNLITQTDKAGNTIGFQYDALNRKVTSTGSLGNVTQFAYDNRNNIIAVTDANGSTTVFQYDRANRLVQETKPLGQKTVYQYDASGNLITRTDPLGQVTAYSYDAAGRRTSISYSSTVSVPASVVTFTYNKAGSLLTWDDGVTSGQFGYDQVYRKTNETVNFGNKADLSPYQLAYSYAYYSNGTKQSFTGPSGDTYQYGYDNANLLSSVTLPDSSVITYNTYNWQAPSRITLPGGTVKTYTYNEFLSPTNIQVQDPGQNVIMNYAYTYDKVNNVLTNQTQYGPYNYTYDNTYRLTRAQEPGLPGEQFGYDPVGNRTSSGTDNLSYSYDTNNQLLTIGPDSRTYDANGNMVTRTIGGVTANFVYDAENRLVGVGTSDGTVVAQYHYDPFGRRLWKNAGGVMTYFMYADEGLIGEYNASGQELASYGYEPGDDWVGNPLFMKQGGQFYFYQNDDLGTPRMLTSAAGAVVWSASYDAFGQAQVGISIVTNNIRLPGQYYDAETGLHYNFQRYYDPTVGRYVSEDPLGFGGGDVNLYAYVRNNPINFYDPYGLWWWGDPLPQWIVDFFAGWGDMVSFGITNRIRDFNGTNSVVNRCSGSYTNGEVFGFVNSVLAGGAIGSARNTLVRGMSRPNPAFPRGIEWVERSHFIPRTWLPESLQWAKANLKNMWGTTHALSDADRYQFLRVGWKEENKMYPILKRFWVGMPNWLQGSVLGAAYGGASAQVNNYGKDCDCK